MGLFLRGLMGLKGGLALSLLASVALAQSTVETSGSKSNTSDANAVSKVDSKVGRTEKQGWSAGYVGDLYLKGEDGGKKELYANMSHFFAQFNQGGNAKFVNIFEDAKSMDGFQFKVNISTLPFLMRDGVEEDLNLSLEEKLAAARPMISRLVGQAVANNPALSQLPQAVRNGIVLAQVNQRVDALRTQGQTKIGSRLDQLSKEYTFQEITIGLPLRLSESSVAYLKLGKEKTESTPVSRDNNEVTPDLAKRLGSTAGTGFVALGHQFVTKEGYLVTSELRVFKTRNAFIDATDYLARTVNMSDAAFENQKNIANLDSVSGMIQVTSPDQKVSASLNVADHDGARGIEATAWSRIQLGHGLSLDLTHFTGSQGKRASSITATQAIGSKYKVYGRYSAVRNFDDAITSEVEADDYDETAVGVSRLMFTADRWGVQCTDSIKVEVSDRDYKDSIVKDTKSDVAIGNQLSCDF